MNTMTTRIGRAVVIALVAAGILIAGAAPYGQPGPHSVTISLSGN